MNKVYKYRLYPTKEQIKSLTPQLTGHRILYNQALAQRKRFYEATRENISFFAQSALLPKIRKENNFIASCNYDSLQQTLRRLDKSFKAFFRRVKTEEKPGYPRFKAEHRFNTFTYGSFGDGCQIKDNRLYLQNVGKVKVKWHRALEGITKTLSVTRRNNKWYVAFIVECEPAILPNVNKSVGIDIGLNYFITTNEGQQIDAPQYFRKSEKKLAKAQKKLSRRKKGSKRRNKARILLSNQYEKISNQRLDFCHKIAYSFVQEYDDIAVEKLNIKGMVQNKYLSKSIDDASWGIFLNILKAKAENAGRRFQEVSAKNTSQICSSCGVIVKKSLAVRKHVCPSCGLSLSRDQNAALNILKRARMEPSVLAMKFVVSPRS